MKRVLVVDDEKPVVDHVVRIIARDLAGEFTVVGTAASGRDALEKFPVLLPDIVVLDVRMPGLSGLDTVRELKRRGAGAAWVLSTAYERFDIAREALELGITGYLLKPVSGEELARALRAAGEQLDLRTVAEAKETDSLEKDDQVRGFVAEAFLQGLMLGRTSAEGTGALGAWLGISKPWALTAAVLLPSRPEEGHRRLEAVLQYKSQALCGPLVGSRCALFLPLADPAVAEEARETLEALVAGALTEEPWKGTYRVGFSGPRALDDLAGAWPEALGRLSGRRTPAPERFVAGGNFEVEEEFHGALQRGDPDGVRAALETLLVPFEALDEVMVADRYRIIALLGAALGRLVGRGHLDEATAHHWMDFDDLRQAADGREFCLLARSRLPTVAGALHQGRRWSMWVASAMEYIRQNYGQVVTLELAADHVGLSPKRLSRLFIDEVGQGFSDFLIDFRIEKAKILLALPGTSIKQVSAECGYPDPNYFSRLFKKVTGTTPTDFSALS